MADEAASRRLRVAHDLAPSTELAVLEHGQRSAPAMVVAHGAGSSARFIVGAFAEPATAAGLRLITYDLRGHAASDPAPDPAHHHLDVHAADLAAVVGSITGRIAVVGGVSLGAHAAVRVVSRGDVDAQAVLACLPAWTGAATAGEGPHAAVAQEAGTVGAAGILARLRGEQGLPQWLRETLVHDYERHDAASLVAALISLDGGQAPSAEELAQLGVPLAVVGWPDDVGHPLAVARAWVTHAEVAALQVLAMSDLASGTVALGRAAGSALRQLGLAWR